MFLKEARLRQTKMQKETYQENEVQYQSEDELPKLGAGELAIAVLVGFSEEGVPLVRFNFEAKKEFEAISTVSVNPGMLGCQVAVMMVVGSQQPVIVGIIKNALDAVLENTAVEEPESAAEQNSIDNLKTSTVDGKRVLIEGEEEIVLKCGESSITLTKAGKILIRGKYLLNRSSGVNRIMGGSVQVN